MSWMVLARSGEKFGPCVKPCKHKDCALTREMAEAFCPFCGEAIGYDTRFTQYTDTLTKEYGENKYWHSSCLETWADQEREKVQARP